MPEDAPLSRISKALKCTRCDRKGGIDVIPDGEAWVRYLRKTGQRDRMPWYQAFVQDGTPEE